MSLVSLLAKTEPVREGEREAVQVYIALSNMSTGLNVIVLLYS